MPDVRHSITSNQVKMFKHLSNLQEIQDGHPSPVLLHFAPTNRCNRRCVHCCFSDRDRQLEIEYDLASEAVRAFGNLGVRALEFTGGGEPTLWPHLPAMAHELDKQGWALGMNTNALQVDGIDYSVFRWVRVALNVFDGDKQAIATFKRNVAHIRRHTKVTACYIVPQTLGIQNLADVVEYAYAEQIPTRIAPDCIQSKSAIRASIASIKEVVRGTELVFLSDFNVYLEDRPDDLCLMHAWKPFLYADGWVYDCPSLELAVENPNDMAEEFRVCHASDVRRFYSRPLQKREHSCSYCKYARQNNLLADVIMEVDDCEFA